jgi:hypothetical protein
MFPYFVDNTNMSITLTTTQAQYEDLHEQVAGKAKSVRVDAQALINLLIDHGHMVREARGHGIKVTEP